VWSRRSSPPCASLRESGSSGSLGSRSGPSSGQGWLRSGQPTRKPRQTSSRRWSGCHRASPQCTRPRDAAVCATPWQRCPQKSLLRFCSGVIRPKSLGEISSAGRKPDHRRLHAGSYCVVPQGPPCVRSTVFSRFRGGLEREPEGCSRLGGRSALRELRLP